MRTYAVRSLPWGLLLLTSGTLIGLLAVVARDPWTLWPLEGTAVGLLAGATGWCFDEPAAGTVDVAPRDLQWRTRARMAGLVVLLAGWSTAVLVAHDALFGHAAAVLVQGVAAASVATTWSCWRRARGEATPGQRWALVVVPSTTAWALVRPFEEQLPVFPYALGGSGGDWTTSTLTWSGVGLLATVGLLAYARRWR